MSVTDLGKYQLNVEFSSMGFFDPDDGSIFIGTLKCTSRSQAVITKARGEVYSRRRAAQRTVMALKAATLVPEPYSYCNIPGTGGGIRFWTGDIPCEFERAAIEDAFTRDDKDIGGDKRTEAVHALRDIILGKAKGSLGGLLADSKKLEQCDPDTYWACMHGYAKGSRRCDPGARRRMITACAGGYLKSEWLVRALAGGGLESGLKGPFYRVDTRGMGLSLAYEDYQGIIGMMTF